MRWEADSWAKYHLFSLYDNLPLAILFHKGEFQQLYIYTYICIYIYIYISTENLI
jgi:hypothetical protein